MDHSYNSQNTAWVLFILFFLVFKTVNAQTEPFQCDYNAYLFQYNDIYSVDLASGSSYLVKENIVDSKINGAAYNSADGYIWGYVASPSKTIIRIGKNFEYDTYTIPEIPVTGMNYVGDISLYGQYYFRAGGNTYYHVDLNPQSDNYLNYMGSTDLDKNINIHDWAFNAVDDMLYTVEKGSNHLYRIEVETGVVLDLGEVPIIAGKNYTYGAVYFDVSGNLYISANQTGTIYIIREVQNLEVGSTMDSNLFAFGPASANNDGARCPSAPVPQENCTNGIDDDGDGLVDCDDPSCSGVSECPIIVTTSSGNNGGLESTNRLSSLINKRNYDRVRTNYTFDKTSAKRVVKSQNYMAKGRFNKDAIPLDQLVPHGVLGETSVIESAPTDLLDLTNASDIYAVDYLYEDDNIGALMVIKTDERVYEHSKFICDRFLGPQLLSVSTLYLREEQPFIKSVIKQQDESVEFAISFSARVEETGRFVIESHWNIDQYPGDTAYYNFQIWSNSIDNAYALAEEILLLLEGNADISQFKGSAPPAIFAKSAKYINGEVTLNLVNNNGSSSMTLDGGIKQTETKDAHSVHYQLPLDGEYLNNVSVNTGPIFDFGFRISDDQNSTPDDLFVADAPWGLDQSASSTIIEHYEVLQPDSPYSGSGYPIERAIELEGSTSEYLGVYRAMTPRFAEVDMSAYTYLRFEAMGKGNLEVALLKGNGETYVTNLALSDEFNGFELKMDAFVNDGGLPSDFTNIKVIAFNIHSDSGQHESKQLYIRKVEFTNESQVVAQPFVVADTNRSVVSPNPMIGNSKLYFFVTQPGTYTLTLHDVNGKLVSGTNFQGASVMGQNVIELSKGMLQPGYYFYKLVGSQGRIWSGRIAIK